MNEFRVEPSESMPEYHNGSTRKGGRRGKAPDMLDREVIAWDMEGMNLSGSNKPQHPVLFGSSADVAAPLVSQRLTSMEMLESIISTAERYPYAIHVGYGFRYDGNMMLQDFSEKLIERLLRDGHARFRADGTQWSLQWIPGKMFTITKRHASGHNKTSKTTAKIYDYSAFFGGSTFLNAAEQILRDELTADDRDVIERGKTARGAQGWDELDDVIHYWSREILLIKRVFEKFRGVMYQAGFALKDWYGPGALANYINTVHKIRPHLAAAQVTSTFMPHAVHEASKVAFSGGRFELFQAGRIQGPLYSIDINSAYPHALTMVPSLDPNYGHWRHRDDPRETVRFGVYRISYVAPGGRLFEKRPHPLFWRDHHGLISYPNKVHGWYYSPEARMVMGMPGVTVHEGWEWIVHEEVFPWEFLHDMYETRQRLGKSNLLSMPFKLGPNSLYGKYAQTIGWNQKENLPPRSHALPVAGWVTSYCRSMLWGVIRQIPDKIIACETDSVFTTVDPATLNLTIGDGLGEWGVTNYDELMYLQSGMYHYKQDGEWRGVRSRGMSRTEYPPDVAAEYLASLMPGTEWSPLSITTKPKFIGAGAALMSEAPFKTQHCVWRAQTREMTFGDTGKRRHAGPACEACKAGHTPYDAPHRLVVASSSDGERLSHPRRLPWEQVHTDVVELIRREEEREKDTAARL